MLQSDQGSQSWPNAGYSDDDGSTRDDHARRGLRSSIRTACGTAATGSTESEIRRERGRRRRVITALPIPKRPHDLAATWTGTTMNFAILPQRPQDHEHFDSLLDRTFGPDRLAKTVYRLRDGIEDLPEMRFVAVTGDGALLASLRFWPVMIETAPAILLGPLAVEPRLQGQGIGRALVGHGLAAARRLEHRICVVVGEPEYYGPFGFVNAGAAGLILPGPVDPRRFQVLELVAGALEGVGGLLRPAAQSGRDETKRDGGTAA